MEVRIVEIALNAFVCVTIYVEILVEDLISCDIAC